MRNRHILEYTYTGNIILFFINMIIIIIGEHIDYCGYGVFPMALEQDIVMAVSVNDDQKLRIYNTNQQFTYDNTHKYY